MSCNIDDTTGTYYALNFPLLMLPLALYPQRKFIEKAVHEHAARITYHDLAASNVIVDTRYVAQTDIADRKDAEKVEEEENRQENDTQSLHLATSSWRPSPRTSSPFHRICPSCRQI